MGEDGGIQQSNSSSLLTQAPENESTKGFGEGFDKDQKFMDYYHNLRSVIAVKVPDGDYEWACTVLEDFRKAGLLKVLVSRMATVKILPGNDTLLRDINKYTRSLKYQMILNSQTSLTRMDSVLSMHSAVIVEVVEGSKMTVQEDTFEA